MRRFKLWLYDKFLPWATKEIYQKDMASLLACNKAQKVEIERLKAYIQGLEYRARTKIVIHNEVAK